MFAVEKVVGFSMIDKIYEIIAYSSMVNEFKAI